MGRTHPPCFAPRCVPHLPLIRIDLIPWFAHPRLPIWRVRVVCDAHPLGEDVGMVREKGAAEMGRRSWASGLLVGGGARPEGSQRRQSSG
jgi:hypothetical protein